jgi:thioredoxin 1
MNKNTGIIIGIIALLVIIGGVYASMNMSKEEVVLENKEEMAKEETMVKEEAMKKEETMKKEDVMVKAGKYESYSAEKIAMAATGDVVIFFHASWCPSCRGLNSDIEKNLNSIPENVIILKADYDKETELKKKYGVTSQHTLVQVDKDGNMIKKWSGGGTLATVVSQIQ